VIVSLDARNGSGLRIVHQHRLNSRDRTFVLPGSFTQEGYPGDDAAPVLQASSG
jgi:hypothetical protein